jgi:hypothetical protein
MNGGPVELPSSDFSRGTVEYSHGVMIFKCNHIRSIIKSEEKVVTLDRPSQEMEIKCTKRIGDNKDYSIWYAVQN